MAEILLKVSDGANYTDGDCLCAFNNRAIACAHVHHLCHIDGAGFNSDGLRPSDAIARDLREAFFQYRFERASQYEIDG